MENYGVIARQVSVYAPGFIELIRTGMPYDAKAAIVQKATKIAEK